MSYHKKHTITSFYCGKNIYIFITLFLQISVYRMNLQNNYLRDFLTIQSKMPRYFVLMIINTDEIIHVKILLKKLCFKKCIHLKSL